MTFTFKIKYLFNKNIARTNIKKYKRLPCHVLIRSNFLNTNSFPSFFKIFLSLTAKSNNVFFFNTKHSSNLINIDLKKGSEVRKNLLLSLITDEKLEFTDAKKLLALIRDTFSPLNIAKSAVQNIISTV